MTQPRTMAPGGRLLTVQPRTMAPGGRAAMSTSAVSTTRLEAPMESWAGMMEGVKAWEMVRDEDEEVIRKEVTRARLNVTEQWPLTSHSGKRAQKPGTARPGRANNSDTTGEAGQCRKPSHVTY